MDNEDELIKAEYIIKDHTRVLALDCVSENDKRKLDSDNTNIDSSPRKRRTQGKNIKLKGQNKARNSFIRGFREKKFCPNILDGETCKHGNHCRFEHGIKDYLAKKEPDISDTCYIYSTKGKCRSGITCRFGSSHISPEGQNLINEDLVAKDESKTLNQFDGEYFHNLRVNGINFEKAERIVNEVDEHLKTLQTDSDTVLEWKSKKQIDWADKLYLSPLTTVGNLPFRRICKEYGADITCSEMAMAHSLLQRSKSEWALLKRHSSEDLFGVQVCGNNPNVMARCAQMLEAVNIDFIDINLGCPIDLVYKAGSGSALLERKNMLKRIVFSMNRILDVPLTIKTRIGVFDKKPVALKHMPMFKQGSVSLITVHGRSREQRYIKSANWDYIEECAKEASPIPVFGNGDILSYTDYLTAREKYPNVKGIMIGRGALMKPWIFREIKEKKHEDPSSTERFEMLQRFVNYGLEHWGSDTMGVENTRRFLLEWLSFLHRYIPTGLLVTPPQKMNQRPPFYKGRDEMETLMASSNCADWIQISEMLLGKVPKDFTFLPKHKANAWK